MKTRNIFTKGLLLASVFAVSGCSSFLDEKDWSSQNLLVKISSTI